MVASQTFSTFALVPFKMRRPDPFSSSLNFELSTFKFELEHLEFEIWRSFWTGPDRTGLRKRRRKVITYHCITVFSIHHQLCKLYKLYIIDMWWNEMRWDISRICTVLLIEFLWKDPCRTDPVSLACPGDQTSEQVDPAVHHAHLFSAIPRIGTSPQSIHPRDNKKRWPRRRRTRRWWRDIREGWYWGFSRESACGQMHFCAASIGPSTICRWSSGCSGRNGCLWPQGSAFIPQAHAEVHQFNPVQTTSQAMPWSCHELWAGRSGRC